MWKHKLILPNVKQMVSINTILYVLDKIGHLYQYEKDTDDMYHEDDDSELNVAVTTKVFTDVRSIHRFDSNLLLLDQKGTLFVPTRSIPNSIRIYW